MNEHLQPRRVFSYLFIVAIAVLFALQWGPGARGCDIAPPEKGKDVAATVNGKDIPAKDFIRAFSNQLYYWRTQGSPITEAMARQLGFDRQILEELVNNEILAQAAAKQGIAASDQEVRKIVRSDKSFEKDGKFDPATYQQVLRDYYRRTPTDYEDEIRRQLSASKLRDLVAAAANVSDDEVKARFQKEGNVAKASIVRFLPSMFAEKAPKPKPGELESFAQGHTKEVADYYEANKYVYHQPERVKARHILINVDKSSPAEAQDAAKKKIEDARKQLVDEKKPFAEVAKATSEDTATKERGGDLGFNERGAWAPEFADAAFSLKPGEISQPVQTQLGWHLIQVDEKKPPEKKELKDVELEIARTLWNREKAKELAKAEAEKALGLAKAGKSLAELFPPSKDTQTNAMRFQTETKPEAIDLGEFNAGTDTLPTVGAAPELLQAVFARESPGALEKVFELGEGYIVCHVAERSRPTDESFTAKKEALRDEAIRAKRLELQDAFIKSLKKDAKVTINDEILKAADVG